MASTVHEDLGLDLLLNGGGGGAAAHGQVTSSVDKIIASLDAADAPTPVPAVRPINVALNAPHHQHHRAASPEGSLLMGGEEEDEDDDDEDYEEEDGGGAPGRGTPSECSVRMHARPASPPQPARLDPAKELEMKREVLFQLNRLARKGAPVSRSFTLASDLAEMQAELDRIQREGDIDKSVRFQRYVTMAAVAGIEKLSGFTPFGRRYVNLDGWSSTVNTGINDFDEIFEELHEKYRGKKKMAPELRLVFSLAGSAVLTHVTNSFASKHLPGLDQVLKQNPSLMKELGGAVMGAMASNAAEAEQGKDGGGGGMGNLMSGLMGFMSNVTNHTGHGAPAPKPTGTMKGPRNFDAMMRELNGAGAGGSRLETFSNASETDISELREETGSVSGYSLSSKGRRKVLHL